MAELQTLPVAASGGLDVVSPPQSLAQRPGVAVELNNYEALAEGGYRKIKGYTRYGDIPDAFDGQELRGIGYYKGIVVVVGDNVLHSYNGETWYVVNKDKMADKAVKDVDTIPLTKLPRAGTGPVEFQVFQEAGQEALVITDNESVPCVLTYAAGSGYTYKEVETADTSGYRYITKYQDHVIIAGSIKTPGAIAVSARFKAGDFAGAGSWGAQVADEIVGLKTFRDYIYIFCKHSIYRVVNLESKGDVQIRPVTTKIGCVDGRTIQEIGGDILFLAEDGLRYLGATERLDDVSLNIVSASIRDITDKIDVNQGQISSVVIPSKSQYRLFYTDTLGRPRGLIGTLGVDGNFAWSSTGDLNVEFITEDIGGEVYHLGAPSLGNYRVYKHDTGITFDGTPFESRWKTPYFHMGDAGIRKALHSVDIYLEAEDLAEIELGINFDYERQDVMQPEPFYLAPVVEASRYGEFRYGQGKYGSVRYPLDAIALEGSGKWVQLTFKDSSSQNSTYVIRGYDLQFNAGGRI